MESVRGKPYANAPLAPDVDDGVCDFEEQAGAVLDGAAVLVGAVVRTVFKKLVEQVAVGGVDLDAIESGGLGVLRALHIVGDDAGSSAVSSARGVSNDTIWKSAEKSCYRLQGQ